MTSRHHVGRFHLNLPEGAELVGVQLRIEGVDCSELDVAEASREAGELAWYQVSDELRGDASFEEAADDRLWRGTANGQLVVLQQVGARGLLLTTEAGLESNAREVARLYTDSQPREGLALRWGSLDIPSPRGEELSAIYEGHGWQLELSSCPLSAVSDSNYEDLREYLSDEGYVVTVGRRTIQGFDGELLAASRAGSFTGVWRCAGSAGVLDEPELEVTLTSSLPLEDARDLWAAVLGSLVVREQGRAP